MNMVFCDEKRTIQGWNPWLKWVKCYWTNFTRSWKWSWNFRSKLLRMFLPLKFFVKSEESPKWLKSSLNPWFSVWNWARGSSSTCVRGFRKSWKKELKMILKEKNKKEIQWLKSQHTSSWIRFMRPISYKEQNFCHV